MVVPCSRSDVFTTDSLSLIEKRLLMKLLEFCHSYDKNPEQVEGEVMITYLIIFFNLLNFLLSMLFA